MYKNRAPGGRHNLCGSWVAISYKKKRSGKRVTGAASIPTEGIKSWHAFHGILILPLLVLAVKIRFYFILCAAIILFPGTLCPSSTTILIFPAHAARVLHSTRRSGTHTARTCHPESLFSGRPDGIVLPGPFPLGLRCSGSRYSANAAPCLLLCLVCFLSRRAGAQALVSFLVFWGLVFPYFSPFLLVLLNTIVRFVTHLLFHCFQSLLGNAHPSFSKYRDTNTISITLLRCVFRVRTKYLLLSLAISTKQFSKYLISVLFKCFPAKITAVLE